MTAVGWVGVVFAANPRGLGHRSIFENRLIEARFGGVWASERLHWPKRLEVLPGDLDEVAESRGRRGGLKHLPSAAHRIDESWHPRALLLSRICPENQ